LPEIDFNKLPTAFASRFLNNQPELQAISFLANFTAEAPTIRRSRRREKNKKLCESLRELCASAVKNNKSSITKKTRGSQQKIIKNRSNGE